MYDRESHYRNVICDIPGTSILITKFCNSECQISSWISWYFPHCLFQKRIKCNVEVRRVQVSLRQTKLNPVKVARWPSTTPSQDTLIIFKVECLLGPGWKELFVKSVGSLMNKDSWTSLLFLALLMDLKLRIPGKYGFFNATYKLEFKNFV
jgi:hypothetical protein